MKKKILGIILLLTLLISGCGVPKLKNGEEVVAKIDGYEITANDLFNVLKKQQGTYVTIDMIDNFISNKEVKTDDKANQTVDGQIAMYQMQYGEEFENVLLNNGFTTTEEFRNYLLINYKKNIVVENYYKGTLTDKEIEEYYEKEIFGEMDVRHILIKPEEKSSEEDQKKANEEALEKAKEMVKKLDEGAKFEDLAKEFSSDSSKSDGGLIKGVTKQEYVNEFFEAAYKLKDNEYTKEPVKSQFGYHVILKISAKEKPTLEESKDKVKTLLVENIMKNDTNAGMKAWFEIRKNYKIEIFDKTINNVYESNRKNVK